MQSVLKVKVQYKVVGQTHLFIIHKINIRLSFNIFLVLTNMSYSSLQSKYFFPLIKTLIIYLEFVAFVVRNTSKYHEIM
jgi:hypothetical protein